MKKIAIIERLENNGKRKPFNIVYYLDSSYRKIFDKLDLLEDEGDFRHVMESLAGNIYSNMNQREDDIAKAFEGSLNLLQNSTLGGVLVHIGIADG